MSDQSPKTILITGASSGIGEALALHYAARGITLVLGGRDHDRLEDVAVRCRDKGANVQCAVIDVTQREAMKAWIVQADIKTPIDLVIANAGISGGTSGADGESEEQIRAIFAVNLDGVLNTIWPVIPAMRGRGAGQIAIMASMASFTGWPGAPAYSGSKAAVRIYGEALRGALRPSGIRVNVICPGFIESRMTAVNDFPMPFLMPAARAAGIIAKSLQRDRPRIAFPWQGYFIAGLVGSLPPSVSNMILTKLPQKRSL